MNKNTENKNTCMACSCPCDMHKEHTHGEKGGESSAKKCATCSHEHKSDGSCDCGCK